MRRREGDRWIERQTDKQTNKHTGRQTEIELQTHREREINK